MLVVVRQYRNTLIQMRKSYGDGLLFCVFLVGGILAIWTNQPLPMGGWLVLGYFVLKGILRFFPWDDFVFSQNFQKNLFLKIFVALLCLIPFFRGESVDVAILFLVFLLIGVFSGLTGKSAFLGALGALILVVVFLLFERQDIAELVSVYLYYLLVIGTVFELLEGKVARFFESDFSFLTKWNIRFDSLWLRGTLFIGYLVMLALLGLSGFFDDSKPLLLLAVFKALVLFFAILGEEDRGFLGSVLIQVWELSKAVLFCWMLVWLVMVSGAINGYVVMFLLGFLLGMIVVFYREGVGKLLSVAYVWSMHFISSLHEKNEK